MMKPDDRKLLQQAEEAALDQGSVGRITGRRGSARRAVREASTDELTSQEEEAALDQGSVERITGTRKSEPPRE